MADNLTAAAQAMGVPEALVKRSAEARAKAMGVSVDEVLTAWAGGGTVAPSAASAPPPPEETVAAAGTVPPPPTPEPAAPAPEVERPAAAAQPAAAAAPAPVTRPSVPEKVTPEEALDYPVVVSVPTAGLKERTASALPRWLAAAFVIIPVFGLLYLAGNVGSAGACEEGGIVLAVDRQTGMPVNCDGSAFEGRGAAGGGGGQFLAIGEEVYPQCAACHGATGGGGVGPALTGVLTTFGACADHVEWVDLGTNGFQAAGRTTYGDIQKPVGGGGTMPGFGGTLTEEQLMSVVAFERVRFGGAAPEEALVDCGLVEPEGEEGGAEEGAAEGSTEEGSEEGTGGDATTETAPEGAEARAPALTG